jgi:serine phosphatase RsbU (regulator of sigma subunit)
MWFGYHLKIRRAEYIGVQRVFDDITLVVMRQKYGGD